MSIVHHLLAVDVVAAAGERYPQALPHLNRVGVGYVIHGLDFLEGDEAREHLRRYVVEPVVRDHCVVGAAVGDSGAPVADAGEGDLDRLVHGHGEGGWGGEGEVVGAEN